MNESTIRLLAIGGLLVAAGAMTALLRWARSGRNIHTAAGWAILGGMMAGIVLGPTVLGRIAPDAYETWFVGGAKERHERDALLSRFGAELLAAEHAQIDRDQIVTMRMDHEQRIAHATESWRQAQWRDQQPLRLTACAIAATLLFIGGLNRRAATDDSQGILPPLSIGVWAAVLPGSFVYGAMVAWWGHSHHLALMVAAACGIGPLMLTAIDQHVADRAELGGARMIQNAGRIASIIAIGAAMYALWLHKAEEGLMCGIPLLALPVGWLIGAQMKRSIGITRLLLLRNVLLATLAALLAVKIELFLHFAFWPIVVVLLLSDDGRWFGAFAGAMLLGGRRVLRTTRLVIGSMSAGPTQLAVAVIGAHAWAIPETLFLPLLLGSLLIEFTARMRRQFARKLTELESELDDRE